MAKVEKKVVQTASAADLDLLDQLVRAVNRNSAILQDEATGVTSDSIQIVYTTETTPRT
jgi:hypothetical protein